MRALPPDLGRIVCKHDDIISIANDDIMHFWPVLF